LSRYKVIKVEDTKESVRNAIQEMQDTLMKGGGIGFDVSGLSKEDQHVFQKEIDDIYMSTINSGKRVI